MPRKKKVETQIPEAAAEVTEVVEAAAEAAAEAPAAEEKPAKKPAAKKPAAKKAAAEKKPAEKKTSEKKAEPVLTTVVQVGDAEFDISGIAEKAYKAYKSTHKRKAVTDFKVYVKPEEGAAYYTVNGEGAADFKVDL